MTIACTLVPSPDHDLPEHPEALERFSLLKELTHEDFSRRLEWLPVAPAQLAEVQAAHSPALPVFLQDACQSAPAIIDAAPTYVTPGSWNAALMAAGGALTCARAVVREGADAGLALVRPPGHHAESGRSMGFCLLNNLAIAVRWAQKENLDRILIVDFDAHHGNGTQDIFLTDDRVAFLSLHQWGIYPSTGGLNDAAQARGRIVNVPLPAYAGDRAFTQAFERILQPLAQRIRPQMIFVSAGYDGHWSDPLTTLGLSTKGFYDIASMLMDLAHHYCQGRIVFVLEGGYEPRPLLENIRATISAMTGSEELRETSGASPFPEPNIAPLVDRVLDIHNHFK